MTCIFISTFHSLQIRNTITIALYWANTSSTSIRRTTTAEFSDKGNSWVHSNTWQRTPDTDMTHSKYVMPSEVQRTSATPCCNTVNGKLHITSSTKLQLSCSQQPIKATPLSLTHNDDKRSPIVQVRNSRMISITRLN